MHMEKIGLISTNLAERIAMLAAEAPYRVTAETISETCGQSISHGGAWNLIQQLGERISEEEEHAVKQMEADQSDGEKVVPILFEEMDGVWLRMQDKHHKRAPKQELKETAEAGSKILMTRKHCSNWTGFIFIRRFGGSWKRKKRKRQ